MKKKALWKDTLREIWKSKARFLSIMAIIMLGVAFFSGVTAAGPDMLDTADTYYKDQHLMDLKVMSTLGLTKEDIDLLETDHGMILEPHYTQDVLFKGTNLTSKVIGYSNENQLNRPLVEEGRMPETDREIALDSTSYYKQAFKIGDTVSFETKEISSDPTETMDRTEFEVVGFFKSPLYIEDTARGNTNLGNGALRGIAYVLPEVFTSDYYTEAYLAINKPTDLDAYTDSYEQLIDAKTKEVEDLLKDRPQERLTELKDEIQEEIDKGRSEISDARKKLDDAEQTLKEERKKLDDAKKQLDVQQQEIDQAEQNWPFLPPAQQAAIQQGKIRLEAARRQLEEGEAQYREGAVEFEEEKVSAVKDIEEAEADLKEAEETRDTLEEPEYFVLDRTTNPGYAEYGENADRMASIARIFPVFFFLLAALISLSTLTRMVEEERNHIGTLKALGYTNGDISLKYFFYALLATILGVSLGVAIGFTLFPTVIFNAYSTMYNLPPVILHFYWSYALLSLAVSLLSTGASALVAVRVSLRSNSAELLRRKAPKVGKRIFLERISFIWNRMGFTKKVTARNLFRYKQRMLMTVIGVAGCTALLLTGFGLSDSISGIAEIQFGEYNLQDAVVSLNPDAKEEDKNSYQQTIESQKEIKKTLLVHQEIVTTKEGKESYDATLFVPENTEDFPTFVSLIEPGSDETVPLTDEGIVVTEKLARLLSLKSGDRLAIEDADHIKKELPVTGITRNYVGNTLYMSQDYYKKHMTEDFKGNTQLLLYKDAEVDEQALGETLTAEDQVNGVSFVSDIYNTFSDTLGSLDVVTVVLIASAALLAMVVLYNLTNINVSERIRELSTIKVLGFYDNEVTMYIYRENIILTAMGVAAGLGVGVLLHRFVLQTAEIDTLMFSHVIHLTSYLYSALLTFLFSAIVMFIMHIKLKKVDMVEALKAQE